MPIRNYTDHAANESTFPAQVRTSIAVCGFGFLVEGFDLFVAALAPKSGHIQGAPSEFGHVAGLTLIVLGMAMIALAMLLLLLCAGLVFSLSRLVCERVDRAAGAGHRIDLYRRD